MNKCNKCNVEMVAGYTIVNDNIHGGLKIARQQRGFDNLCMNYYMVYCFLKGQPHMFIYQ